MTETQQDLFLQKQARERLELYRIILRAKARELTADERVARSQTDSAEVEEVNLRRLATILDRNYGTLYYTYTSLLEMLKDVSGQPDGDIETLFKVSQGDLRFYLVKQGVPYRFLQHLVAEDLSGFDEFVAQSEVSRVTVLRYLRPMRDMAKRLGVRMIYEKVRLQGSEAHIRLFLTLVFWLASDGAQWPFDTVSRAAVTQKYDELAKTFDLNYQNPVIRELVYYELAVGALRIQHGHQVGELPAQLLTYPVPNLFNQKDPLTAQLSTDAQYAESQMVYMMNFVMPMYYARNSPMNARAVATFQRYNPQLYAFVDEFLHQMPGSVFDPAKIDDATRELMMANLLAITAGALVFGFDIGQIIAYAFNRAVRQTGSDDRYQMRIRQTVETVLVSSGLGKENVDVQALTDALYANIIQVRQQIDPVHRVRVALMLEPVALGFVDLVMFLEHQPFVEVLNADFETADLVIQSSELPLGFHPPMRFKWHVNATSDAYGELYAVLHAILQEKNHPSDPGKTGQ